MQWNKQTILDILDMPYGMSGQHLNSTIIAKMLVSLYQRQTQDEKSSQVTRHHNGVGFNMFDASYLTSIAAQTLHQQKIPITELEEVSQRLIKYSKQLAKIAESKQQAQQKEAA